MPLVTPRTKRAPFSRLVSFKFDRGIAGAGGHESSAVARARFDSFFGRPLQ